MGAESCFGGPSRDAFPVGEERAEEVSILGLGRSPDLPATVVRGPGPGL
jgi:hypothetical protein